MEPIKTVRFDGVYGAPKGYEEEIGGLPYFREYSDELKVNEVFSVWELSDYERNAIFRGANILVGQVGEPIRAMSVQITDLEKVTDGDGEQNS